MTVDTILTTDAPANLEDLRERLLAPHPNVRDENGYLIHPAMPSAGENIRCDDLLAVFGIETAFIAMESDAPAAVVDRYFEAEEPGCPDWTPTPPADDGWNLLEIYDTEDGPYALFGRAMPKEVWPRSGGKPFDMRAHLIRQITFSHKTFGPGQRTQGVIDHIRKELREIETDPHSVEEWIDVALLALDGAQRTMLGHFRGHRPVPPHDVAHAAERIVSTLVAKQTKKEGRQWPDWRTADLSKAIEHKKDTPA